MCFQLQWLFVFDFTKLSVNLDEYFKGLRILDIYVPWYIKKT
jgi:hypothetical protein